MKSITMGATALIYVYAIANRSGFDPSFDKFEKKSGCPLKAAGEIKDRG
jgi:hypothetical protein